ncbi:uncharacterized protein [Argopecten irradians]|uniref:uncharacterized protein n=1 Tax=Argopecten irradians TaxID=31199 RepID=UPI00371C23A2
MESVLFWITIASCFVSVQMAVWEPLLILNVTGKKSVSPLDIWNDQESRQPPQDITAEDWIRDENKTSPFVSDRISHWDIVRPEMIEVKAVNFKHNDVQIVQSILFNTTTSNSSSFDDWMKEEYLSNQNRTTEAIETPAQLQPRNALFRYNYTSNGAIGKILGGMTFLLDTRNVSERGSLLLTSDVRNIGNIDDILFNLNTHMYQSSMQGTEEVFNSNNQERISSTNHKIVFRERITTEQRRLVRLRYEMEEGVFVKNLSIRSSGPFVVNMTLNDGSQTSEVADILNFYKEYNKRILTIVITPEMPELKFIYGMEVNVMYTCK